MSIISNCVRRNSVASMATVLSTSLSNEHNFTKQSVPSITLVKDLGVQGDAHFGETVQHRSRLHIRPSPTNLRQVHLIHNEILVATGLQPAEIGENITTQGIDLLGLSCGTKLHFVRSSVQQELALAQEHAVVVVTGLRNPCPQIERHRKGLQEKFIVRDEQRKIVARKAGVMSVVEVDGVVMPGMTIIVEKPDQHVQLEPV